MNKLLCLLIALCTSCAASPTTTHDDGSVVLGEQIIPHDDTHTVQVAASAHTCLPAGDYYVMTPPLPRHDYAVLGGAVGCDPANPATLYFVGDAGGKLWVGLAPRSGDSVRNIRFDSSGLVNADPDGKDGQVEQTHAVHMYPGVSDVTIQDNEFNHPVGGDCINQVGPDPTTHTPAEYDTGLVVVGNRFVRCHRGAVQLSRSLAGAVIAHNEFLDDGFDIGSEGAGGLLADGTVRQTVLGAVVEQNYFTSQRGKGFAVQAEWWNDVRFTDNVSDARPWELYGTDYAMLEGNVVISQIAAYEALIVGDRGWHISSNDDYVSGVAGSLAVRQLGRGRPSDLGDVVVTGGVFRGDVTFRGVTGATLTSALVYGAVLTPCGLTGSGQCTTPTTDVTITR